MSRAGTQLQFTVLGNPGATGRLSWSRLNWSERTRPELLMRLRSACHKRARTGGEWGSLTVSRGDSKSRLTWACSGQGQTGEDLLSSRSRVRITLGAPLTDCRSC